MKRDAPDKVLEDHSAAGLPSEAAEFPIVGIGASAGGLAAFERFFSHLSPHTGMAFVVIQHLSPPHKSILPDLIQRFTAMMVVQVTDGVEVKPNCVYVIPPSNNLALMDGHLILLKPPSERGFRFPIDFFFRSLAEVRRNQAIGIVLSGNASDGSLGIKNIKAEGGLTIAQEPETAEFGDMPRNAIATRDVDFVLPPEKMGELILKVVHHQMPQETQTSEAPTLAPVVTLQRLYHLLQSKTGHDFSLYKQNTLLRRIERRMKLTMMPTLEAYIEELQRRPEEIDALFREMLINVTQFFRDPKAFQALVEKAIRPLLSQKLASQVPLRVWAAGCSSGEEAYSIAIAIQEQIDALKADTKVQIFATDLDAEAIATARRGFFTDGSLENVSSDRLQRFFTREEDGYQIKKSIRDQVVFSVQNLIYDAPFSKIDLICCRNVLIYLETELQKQLFPLFHYALNPGGVLFLGNSETIGSFSDLFGVIDRKHRLFYRMEAGPQDHTCTRIHPSLPQAGPAALGTSSHPARGRIRERTEKALLSFYTPACVMIDENHNILYFHGRTGKFLEPAPGETSANLPRMAREGLKADLMTAIHTATVNKEAVTRRGIRVKTNGEFQFVNLTVRPLAWEGDTVSLMMVVFEEAPGPAVEQAPTAVTLPQENYQVAELEKALKEKDEYLTHIINELEEINQDLKSTNEELMSSNEEMQSTNEELETSKEELQSLNEELSTVNAELQNKNAELTALNNDVYNLLASTEIGTLFLDLDMQIRRFTPSIQRIYAILPEDAGRPLHHFHTNLNYPDLLEDIHRVILTLVPKAVEAQSNDGTWYLVNIKPYRTLENVVDGAVVTFVDVTQQKQGDELRRLATVVRDSNDAITVQDVNGEILAWNRGAVQMYGWTEAEALRMNALDLIPEHLRGEMIDVHQRLFQGESIRSYETKRVTRQGTTLDVWITLSVLVDDMQRPVGIATTERDITERKRSDQRLLFENRALKALNTWVTGHKNPETTPSTGYPDVCKMLVEVAGYRLAWMGQVNEGEAKTLVPAAWAGFEDDGTVPPKSVHTLAKRSQRFVETALHNRRPVVIQNIHSDPAHKSWRMDAQKQGYNSFVVLPLRQGNDPLGVLVIYAAEADAFVDPETEPLMALAAGISQVLEPG